MGLSPKRWFIPAWCGDFRLEGNGDGTCVLTIENPTIQDRERLSPFLLQCAKEGILTEAPILNPDLTRMTLHASMATLGPRLAAQTAASSVWTVVACVNGEIRLTDGTSLPATPSEPEAAATLATPERGCPMPAPANRRASEVLAAFSTPRQRESFEAHGRMKVIGNRSGRSYYVYHRDEAAKRGLSRCIATAQGEPICAWDATVPAEEEVLSLKLALEHREAWLLQKARGAAIEW